MGGEGILTIPRIQGSSEFLEESEWAPASRPSVCVSVCECVGVSVCVCVCRSESKIKHQVFVLGRTHRATPQRNNCRPHRLLPGHFLQIIL